MAMAFPQNLRIATTSKQKWPLLRVQSGDNSKDSTETIFYNDFEDVEFGSEELVTISELLQQRSKQLKLEERQLLKNWRSGKAKSYGAFTINERYLREGDTDLPFDWVRRVDFGQYPRVVCGSAYGSIFVADVEAKNRILGEARDVHYSQHTNTYTNCLDEKLREYIYGEYDGGGVLDVAMYGKSLVASAGREGGVKLFKLIENDSKLEYQEEITPLITFMSDVLPVIVTCMKFDSSGRLFLGCSDGCLRIVSFPYQFLRSDFALDSEGIQVTVIPPFGQPSPILALDISESLNMVVTAHVSGDACVHSIIEEDGTIRGEIAGVWNPFDRFMSRGSHARSITFASMERRGATRHAVVVGGGNGEIWINDIDPASSILFVNGDAQKFKPDHTGPVLSLASRHGGIVISAGQDGVARVTHCWMGRKDMKTPLRNELAPLYGIVGLKVWVGSICVDSDGKRLASDGFDDAVVLHDFSGGKDDDSDEEDL
jgi:WD40 repeat protein